jgi:hypothetical protein
VSADVLSQAQKKFLAAGELIDERSADTTETLCVSKMRIRIC